MNGAIITKIRFRIALWLGARLLPVQISGKRRLADVLLLAKPPRHIRYAGLSIPYILKHVVKTTRRPILMRDRRCLRQGLLAVRFMGAAGYGCELHFGIDQTTLEGSLKAHCWLVHRGKIVLNPPNPATVPILIHAAETV